MAQTFYVHHMRCITDPIYFARTARRLQRLMADHCGESAFPITHPEDMSCCAIEAWDKTFERLRKPLAAEQAANADALNAEHEPAGGYALEPRLAPGTAKCDFCSAHAMSLHYFPCRDAYISSECISRGGWAACRICQTLVKAGERDKLLQRACARGARRYPQSSAAEIKTIFQKAQDTFWENRLPEPAAAANDRTAE